MAFPGPPYTAWHPTLDVMARHDCRYSNNEWLGQDDTSFQRLNLETFRYPWHPLSRSGVTLAVAVHSSRPRPDVQRFRSILAGIPSVEAERRWASSWSALPGPHRNPVRRTFVSSPDKTIYVDTMAMYFFGLSRPERAWLPLTAFRSLFVYPSSYSNTCAAQEAEKAAMSTSRLHDIIMWVSDWPTVRHLTSAASRITPHSEFAVGVSPSGFAGVPTHLRSAVPPPGDERRPPLVVALVWLCRCRPVSSIRRPPPEYRPSRMVD